MTTFTIRYDQKIYVEAETAEDALEKSFELTDLWDSEEAPEGISVGTAYHEVEENN